MFRLIRLALISVAIYLFFRIGWPEGEGPVISASYHLVVSLVLLAGSVAVFFLIKVIQFASSLAELGVELAFLAGTAIFVGFTLPQRSGVSPLQQLRQGRHPTRSTARDGLAKLGVDPDGAAGNLIAGLFPKK